MIIGCPACRRSYRLDDDRFRPGAGMRCTRCGHRFVPAAGTKAPDMIAAPTPAGPASGSPEPAADAVPAARPVPGPPPPVPVPPSVEAVPPSVGAAPPNAVAEQGGSLAILADAGRPFRDRMRPVLEMLGFRVLTVEEGTEAFRAAVSRRPTVMVASVHLAGLSGVAICEGIKGSPHLKGIKVAIVGSELSADLFNPDTARAYGADLFLDERMSSDDLRHALGEMIGPAAALAPAPADLDDPLAALTADGPPAGAAGEDIARLARIMLSDLRLYNPDRFATALREGRLLETFKDELARGRDLVDHRFPDVPARQELLLAALRAGIENEAAGQPAALPRNI